MARKLFTIRNGRWVGEFPHDPIEGWESGRRGIRRTLCKVSDLDGLDHAEKTRRLSDLYHIAHDKLRREQSGKAEARNIEKQRKKNITIRRASKLWLEEVAITNSPQTLQKYTKTISYYLQGIGDHRFRDFDRSYNIKFLKHLGTCAYQGRPMSESTKNSHLRQFEVFLRWAYDHEIIDRIWSLKKPKVPRRDMDTYTVDDLRVLKNYIQERLTEAEVDEDTRQIKHMRNMLRAYMMATHSLLRLGPIWAMRLENIDLDKRVIRVQNNPELKWVNKMNKWPLKPINEKLAAFLEADIEARDPREVYFLDNGRGYPWYADRADISKLASKMCAGAGLPKLKPFHWGMRATMITALLSEGVDPVKVQQLADHDDISTTMLYRDSRRISQEEAANRLADLL
ncbi:hypothetical protein RE428_07600 [Marinobacter nanhaiticus D15-8W]|uniref:Site-specific integrase n=1 Tax=Marinobacter nanhaiticus D15-8W TaxID=626887 RepID=N6WSX6_9GAMM|nr:site-specific integrase [Marinobacter nanhaiticus]ENO14616.1 site-specific integrase [Marinobacter nanhaiticus D15-8W]BES69698.1 hypothetical protein RE428_07160 [Marinobacter nanhaiticus D15-8W]BES69742.1 hypothetical protein RE428_07600 [Marinobacter nanhaiticus D15-8W]